MTDTIQITMPRALAVKFFDLFGTQLGEEVSSTLSKAVSKGGEKAAKAAAKADKKPRANAGQTTAWSEWTVLKKTEHKADIEVYIAKRIDDCKAGKVLYTADQDAVKLGRAAAGDPVPEKMAKVGAHLSWLKAYKAEHEAEWLSFKAQWEAEHPKGSRAASVADGASEAGSAEGADEAEKPKRGRKTMTQEQKDAAKAKRDAKKAAAAAASPDAPAAPAEDEAEEGEAVDLTEEQSVAAPAEVAEAEEVDDDLLPFSKGGVDYLRWGHLDADGDEVWHPEGWTWLKNADGSKGAFAGKMVGTKLDKSAEAMADEPEFE
jgi:hypothetical protein